MDGEDSFETKQEILRRLGNKSVDTKEERQKYMKEDSLGFFLRMLNNLAQEQKGEFSKMFEITYQNECDCPQKPIFKDYSLLLGLNC